MRIFLLTLVVLAGSLICIGAVQDRVTAVDPSDKAMNSAIASAKGKLPLFWSKLEKPGPGESDFNLKVRISDKNGVEHFWCSDIQRENGQFSGILNNDPETVKNVYLGQRVVFTDKQISDWLYMRDGKMIGNYTIRPLMRDMSKEQRRELEAMLGPLP